MFPLILQLQTDDNSKNRSTTLMQKRTKILLEKPDITLPQHIETIIRILQKTARQKLELNFLMNGFQMLNFFKDERMKLSENSYQSLFKELGYKSFSREDPIFNYGDFGHTFYIILKGSVSILLPKEDVFLEMQKEKKYESAQSLLFEQFLSKRVAMNRVQFRHRNPKIMTKIKSPTLDIQGSQSQRSRQEHQQQENQRQEHQNQEHQKQEHQKQEYQKQEHQKQDHQKQEHQKQEYQKIEPPKLSINTKFNFNGEDQSVLSETEDDHSLNAKYLERYLNQVYTDFNKIRILQAGDAFGEIALMSESKRTATIICNEDCDIMTLTKESFNKILGDQHSQQMNDKTSFLQKFEFFKQVPLNKLLAIIHQMSISTPKLHEIIYKENDKSSGVYFLFKGEVEISLQVNMKNCLMDKAMEFSYFQKNQNKVGQKNISVSILTEGASFGYEEMLTNVPRQSRAVSKSNETILYKISQQILKADTEKIDGIRSQRLKKNIRANQTIHKQQKNYESSRRYGDHPSMDMNSTHLKDISLFKMVKDYQIQEEHKEAVLSRVKSDSDNYELWELLSQNQEIKKYKNKHTPTQFTIATIKHNLDTSKSKSNLTPKLISQSYFTSSKYTTDKVVETQQDMEKKKESQSFRSVAVLSSFSLVSLDHLTSPKTLNTSKVNQQEPSNKKNIHTQRLTHNVKSKTTKINSLLQAMHCS